MMEKITDFLKQFLTHFNQLKLSNKIIIVTLLLTVFFFVVFTVGFSTQSEYTYLFKKPLSLKEYGVISAELQKMNETFQTIDDKYILVQDEETGSRIRMTLAQNNLLPEGIKGWELFDMESWTTTEFDRNIKLRRAIEGEIRRHIETLNWIEIAEVSIALPEKSLYTERDKDVTAAVTIVPMEGYYDYLKKKKMIMGIRNIVAKGVDGINVDNIVITDQNGNELSNFSDNDYEQNIKQAIEENKVKEQEIRKIKRKVVQALLGVLSRDRFRVAVGLEMNFNRKSINQKEILPIVVKERTPGLPYDDSVIKDTLKVSSKVVNEEFEGLGFLPEGPAGVEDNLPPGYKESLDGRNRYIKNEEINNYVNGEKVINHIEDALEIERKSISVSVDGVWEEVFDKDGNYVIENNRIKREYIPLNEEYMKKLDLIVKGAISYEIARGDLVVVKNIPFDRIGEFRQKDADILNTKKYTQWGFYSILAILILFFGYVLYRTVEKFIKENIVRKRKEQESLARLQREQILSDLDEVKNTDYSNLKEEDKEYIRLQEEVNTLVKSEPENTAKVISAWLSERAT